MAAQRVGQGERLVDGGVGRRQVARLGGDDHDPGAGRRAERQEAGLVAHERDGSRGGAARQGPVCVAVHDAPVGWLERGQPAAQAPDPRAGGVDPRGGHEATKSRLAHACLQALLRRAIGCQEQEVHACPQRHEAVHDAGAALRHGLHVHGIGDGDALRSPVGAQQAVHDQPGDGGRQRPVTGHGRQRHVAGHDHRGTRSDGGAEGHQLAGLEHLDWRVHHAESVMRVHVHGSEAREVLGRGRHATRLQAARQRRRVASHVVRVRPEGARAEADVAGLEGQVADGCVADGDAQGSQLIRRGPADGLGERLVVGRPEGHGAREAGRLVAQAHQLAALLVGADEQGQVVRRGTVELPGQAGQAVSVAGVGAQEERRAVGLPGRHPPQEPGRRLPCPRRPAAAGRGRRPPRGVPLRHAQPLTEPDRMPRTK